MTFQATREIRTGRKGLLEEGFDFGFGIFTDQGWGLLDALPPGARGIIDAIWNRDPATAVPPVISEIPEGWETVIIGGEERLRVPEEIGGGPEPVLEPFDPSVVIGEVQGADTAQQNDVGEEDVAHDWGHLGRQILGGWLNGGDGGGGAASGYAGPGSQTYTENLYAGLPVGGGAAAPAGGDCDGMAWSGGTPPKGYKVVNSCGKGVLRRVRRRRRRRMLTSGDKDDIASIVSMVGKGQMAAALINGSMRRG